MMLDRAWRRRPVALRDDMAACVIAPAREPRRWAPRAELLEVGPGEVDEGLADRFLAECGVAAAGRGRVRGALDHRVHGAPR